MRSVMPRRRNMGKEICGYPTATLALERYANEVVCRTRTHLTRPHLIVDIIVRDATNGILVGLGSSHRSWHIRWTTPYLTARMLEEV